MFVGLEMGWKIDRDHFPTHNLFSVNAAPLNPAVQTLWLHPFNTECLLLSCRKCTASIKTPPSTLPVIAWITQKCSTFPTGHAIFTLLGVTSVDKQEAVSGTSTTFHSCSKQEWCIMRKDMAKTEETQWASGLGGVNSDWQALLMEYKWYFRR